MDGKSTCKLLVVDDDKTILKLFATALGRMGYDVSTAESGLEGLRMATETPVDVVLLDINLPDLSGIDVMRQIIKTSSTIVILISGDGVSYSHESALQDGAADLVVKPVRLAELAMHIRQAQEVRSLKVANESLTADLEHMVVRDELTGLFNLQQFQELLKGEVQRALRYQRPLSLVVIDADHFKTVNDTVGRAEGDRVLAGIAQLLAQKVRATDTAFRYSGEKFAMLLPETHGDQAVDVAERRRQAIEESELLTDLHLTVSAGVAEFQPTDDADALLRRADSALNKAKQEGRNRVARA